MMAFEKIVYKCETEPASSPVGRLIRKFESLGSQTDQSTNYANHSLVTSNLTGAKECGRGRDCPGTGIRHRDVSAQFSKGTYDRRQRTSETTAKPKYVLDDTSFVCPCCQRCYQCPIAAAAKAAGYNAPCTGKEPGDLSAKFGRETCDSRRTAPETAEKLSYVLDDSSFECPRCQRSHRCPFIVAAKAAHYIEPCTGRRPEGLSAHYAKEICDSRRTASDTTRKLLYVVKDSSLVCPRCQRRYRCPFADAAKAAQNIEPKEITLREKTVKRRNGTEGFPHEKTWEYSFNFRPSVDRRSAGFVRRSVERIEALLLCKK